MTDTSVQQTSVARWQRRLLPGEFVEAVEGRRSPRDWVVDVLLVLAALTIGALSLDSAWPDHSDAMVLIDVVVGITACLSLWGRRTYPRGVAVAAIAAASFSSMAGGAAPIAVYNVALRSSRRALIATAGLALASIAIASLLYPSAGRWIAQMLFGILVLAVAIGWGLFTRVRRELFYSLRERAERVESEERLRLEQAREAERRRIAREMHDVLAHRLSLLSVHAGALEFRPDADPKEIGEAAGVIRATAQTALQELRDVIGVLREDAEESTLQPPQPTLAQLPALIEESRAAGMHIRLTMDAPIDEGLPAALGRTAYRVVQEGLTNARKHAPGAAVDVMISSDDQSLHVEVVNKHSVAASTAGSDGSGAGLVGLAERVSLAGGELEHGPNEAGDFVLRATLPWTPS
jgi:signal transduction histidine kinase